MNTEENIEMKKLANATSPNNPVAGKVPEEEHALRDNAPEIEHQTSRLISSLTTRAKQITTLVILCVVLVAAVSGLVSTLFKAGTTGSALQESLKILAAINNLQQMPGVLGAIQFNYTHNETTLPKWTEMPI